MVQDKLINEKDEFVGSLQLTPEKIREDLEKMRDVEGFPIGDVEDILELSDPPYYTAYPNPYIKDFIEYYGTPYDEETDDYEVEPFVENESHGRTDSVYNIHFYHTKVPPQAISSYIKHYTEKGELVLDFFAGSGMTGVAGLRLNRYPVLIDLSPFASFIEYNNINYLDSDKFKEFAYDIYIILFTRIILIYIVSMELIIFKETLLYGVKSKLAHFVITIIYFSMLNLRRGILLIVLTVILN